MVLAQLQLLMARYLPAKPGKYQSGAYSDSRGLPGIRKEIAEFIERRDGYPR